jgi:hypothetical protein
MNTATDSLESNTPKTGGGFAVGQSSSDLVGFWGTAPCDQPASLTAQLTTITMADTAGTPDYTLAAITTTTPAGFASIQEAISFAYVVRNLQVRLAEVEARLEECGLIASN